MPSHPAARAFLAACGVPVAAPSANLSGEPSPTTAQHVLTDLNGQIPLILDGGPCEVGLESTVLDLTAEPPAIVRPGGVTREMLLLVLPRVNVAPSVMRPLAKGEKPVSPGMAYRHYAPRGELTLVRGEPEAVRETCLRLYREAEAQGKKACVLTLAEHARGMPGAAPGPWEAWPTPKPSRTSCSRPCVIWTTKGSASSSARRWIPAASALRS